MFRVPVSCAIAHLLGRPGSKKLWNAVLAHTHLLVLMFHMHLGTPSLREHLLKQARGVQGRQ